MVQDPRVEKVARAMCRAMELAEEHDARSPVTAAAGDLSWKSFERDARLAVAAHDALQGKPSRRVYPRGNR